MLESPWEELLHYGLLLGAVFQLICIAAIIFLPPQSEDQDDPTVTGGVKKQTVKEKTDGKKQPSIASGPSKKGKGARKRRYI